MLAEDMLPSTTLSDRDMPYVMFKTESVPDPVRTKADGLQRFKNQDYAVVTVPGDTKANFIDKIEAFFDKKEQEARAGRVKPEWIAKWRLAYEHYQKGQELPLEGTPIKGWKLLTGAQQDELVRMNVRTVEALANLTDDGIRSFGMGAVELKRRAKAWIAQNEGAEANALKLADLSRENDSLRDQVLSLSGKLDELEKALQQKKGK
jgi:hypothetical protein